MPPYTLLAAISVSYSYDPANRQFTFIGNDLPVSDSTCLITQPKGWSEVCYQHTFFGDAAPCGGNTTWNYCTSETPGLQQAFQQSIRTANQAIIDAAINAGFNVIVRTPPPAMPPENDALKLVYDLNGRFKELFDPGKSYGGDVQLVGAESVWYGEITLSWRENFANVIGSTGDPRVAGLAWRRLWENQFGPASACSSLNYGGYQCSQSLVGGHVILGTVASTVPSGSNSVFVMPICGSHNANDSVYMAAVTINKGIALSNYYGSAPIPSYPPGTENPGQTTPASPAVAMLNGVTYLFWRANDANGSIYYSSSPDGQNWSASTKLTATASSSVSPSVCAFNGALFVFWISRSSSVILYTYSSMSSGSLQFLPEKQCNPKYNSVSSISPMAYTWPYQGARMKDVHPEAEDEPLQYDEMMFIHWRDSQNRIMMAITFDGTFPWANYRATMYDTTSAAPTACSYNKIRYLFWIASDGSNRIFYTTGEEGPFGAGGVLNGVDSSPFPVSAVAGANGLNLFWRANDPSNQIYTTMSTDGQTWPNGAVLPNLGPTTAGPASFAYDGVPEVFWIDGNGLVTHSSMS